MRDRDPRVGGRGHAGGHARHDLERDARRGERLGLLAAAAEHERVAALEAHHALARPAQLDEQRVDLLLAERGRARLLADVAQLGVRPGAVERTRRDQAVVEDRVGARDQLQRAARHQARIAGPGADEVDDAAHAQAPSATRSASREQLAGAGAPAGARPRRRRARRAPRTHPRAGRGSTASRRAGRRRRVSRESARPCVTACAPTGVWQLASSAVHQRPLGRQAR